MFTCPWGLWLWAFDPESPLGVIFVLPQPSGECLLHFLSLAVRVLTSVSGEISTDGRTTVSAGFSCVTLSYWTVCCWAYLKFFKVVPCIALVSFRSRSSTVRSTQLSRFCFVCDMVALMSVFLRCERVGTLARDRLFLHE